MKQLFTEAAESFVIWLTSGTAIFVRLVSTTLEAEDIYTDILCEVLINGQKALLHVEFQKKRDSNMAERLWAYNVRATLKYKCPVWSCVIYLTKDSTVDAHYCKIWPDGELPIHRFDFSVIKMWEISTRELLAKGLSDLAPLLVLTREGKRREVIETAIDLLDPPEKLRKRELLALTYGLASLVFSDEADQNWLAWRFSMLYDILKDTRAFRDMEKRAREEAMKAVQEAMKEAREEATKEAREEATKAVQEAMKEAREEAMKEAWLERLRNDRLAVLEVVEARFADLGLVERVRAFVETIDDLEMLRHLMVKMVLAHKAEEVIPLLEQSTVSSSAPAKDTV